MLKVTNPTTGNPLHEYPVDDGSTVETVLTPRPRHSRRGAKRRFKSGRQF
ncbi:MAG: hypothetical protein R2874_02575 [Desulfobacterales bacterium]